jgi:N-acetylmuramoyl-L-alanine amidase
MKRNKKFSSVGKVLNPTKLYKTDKRDIKKIVVHCTASSSSNTSVDAKMVDGWHLDRGWSGIGYHYLIKRDGTLEKGRWVDNAGAHAKGYNRSTIGVVYAGGIKGIIKGKYIADYDNMTDAQHKTLITTLNTLKDMYNLKNTDIIGHNELPKVTKDCPCLTMSYIRDELK